jgi:hypothetical protein
MSKDLFVKFFQTVLKAHGVVEVGKTTDRIFFGYNKVVPQDGQVYFILKNTQERTINRNNQIIIENNKPTKERLTDRIKQTWSIDIVAYNKNDINGLEANEAVLIRQRLPSLLNSNITKEVWQRYYPLLISLDSTYDITDATMIEMTQNLRRFVMRVPIIVDVINEYDIYSYDRVDINSVLSP